MKRGTAKHPKVYDLCERLKCGRPAALGYLTLLWEFAADYAPQGDVGRYPDKRIEAALDWRGGSGRLVEALTKSGWLDTSEVGRLLVHDWRQHAEESVRRKLHRAGLQFLGVTPKVTGKIPVSDGQLPDSETEKIRLPLPLPKPLPVPSPGPTPDTPDYGVRYRALYEKHVIPGFQQDGEYEYAKIITEAVNPERTAELIDQSHAEWMAYFHANPTVYRPGIGKWLHDGYYTRKPESREQTASSRKQRVLDLARERGIQ